MSQKIDESSSQEEFVNENNEENNNMNIDENESKNKTHLFNFIASLIGEETFPFPLRFIFYIIETFQLLSLAFYNDVHYFYL